jgi:protease YdgD
MRRSTLLILCVAALLPAIALAAPQRIRVDATEYPFSAVGRLNVAGHSYCSAVLVGERIALTAAHCLWLTSENRWWPPSVVHFVPGYQGGDAPLHALAIRYLIADCAADNGAGCGGPRRVDADWAVVELAEPLGRTAGWIAVGAAGRSDLIGRLGYRMDSRHAMTLDFGCIIAPPPPGNDLLFRDDCGAVRGDSGGPVLAFGVDGVRLIGLTAATMKGGAAPQALSVAAAAFADHARFPAAAQVLQSAAVGRSGGHPPAAGALPAETIRMLDPDDAAPPSFARLYSLLAKAAAAPAPRP